MFFAVFYSPSPDRSNPDARTVTCSSLVHRRFTSVASGQACVRISCSYDLVSCLRIRRVLEKFCGHIQFDWGPADAKMYNLSSERSLSSKCLSSRYQIHYFAAGTIITLSLADVNLVENLFTLCLHHAMTIEPRSIGDHHSYL